MGLLDRFKNKKEKELVGEAPAASESKKETAAPKKAPAKKAKAEPKKETKAEAKPAKAIKVVQAATARIIIAPVVTEKAAHLAAARTYVFEVARDVTRTQVATAFKELYGVKPSRVNIVNTRSEPVRFGRSMGHQVAWKKAMITLPEGKESHVYDAV